MPQQRSPKASSSRNQQKQRISPSQSRPERLEQRRYSYLVSESESPIYISPYSPVPPSVPVLPSQRTPSLRESPYTALSSGQYLAPESIVVSAPMSAYSSSSQDSAVYSIPGPRQYTFVTATMMSNPRNLSQVGDSFPEMLLCQDLSICSQPNSQLRCISMCRPSVQRKVFCQISP